MLFALPHSNSDVILNISFYPKCYFQSVKSIFDTIVEQFLNIGSCMKIV